MSIQYGGNTEFYQKAAVSKLSIKDIFSDVFKKHEKEDGERLFMAGTSMSTPAPSRMLAEWKKPWVFARVGLLGLLIIFLLAIFLAQGFNAYIPILFFSSFVMPFAVLLLYWELNIPRNIPIYEVIKVLLVGGVMSLLFTAIFKGITGNLPAYLAPLTEEPAKLLALCCFLRKNDRSYILNGILIGGAVGAGFASIETMAYGMEYGAGNLLVRGILAPGGHVLWAAMYGGALAFVKGSSQLRWEFLHNKKFLKYFGAAFLLHFVWNNDSLQFVYIPFFGSLTKVILIVVGWMMLLNLVKEGVNQVVEISGSVAAPIQPKAPFVSQPLTCITGISGQYLNNSIPIADAIVLGRDPKQCNLIFSNVTPGVSAVHCEIRRVGGAFQITDRGSSYGTYIGSSVKLQVNIPYTLSYGDVFFLGSKDNSFRVE